MITRVEDGVIHSMIEDWSRIVFSCLREELSFLYTCTPVAPFSVIVLSYVTKLNCSYEKKKEMPK